MPKKPNCHFLIGKIPYHLHLSCSTLQQLNVQDFFSSYPHFYFQPKEKDFELFASGAIFTAHTYCNIISSDPIPFCVAGSKQAPSWQELGDLWGWIPQKWMIKSKGGVTVYEFDHPSIFPQLNSTLKLPSSTTQKQAQIGIETIQEAINSNLLSKCIYAQIKNVALTQPVTLKSIIDHPSESIKFFIQWNKDLIFTGMSPEYLYKKEGQLIFIDALAGTAYSQEGLDSQKIKDEFNFVKQDIQESIASLITSGSFDKQDSYLTHHHIMHRHNIFKGVLKTQTTHKELIEALHPSAAISGYPKKEAQDLIKKVELFDRGLYASGIGFYTPLQARIAVGIRSLMVDRHHAYLFAGSGITKESTFASEYQELQEKLELMSSLIS